MLNELKGDFMVFSGSANPPLAEKVASYLGKPLNKIDIKHFPDGETFCQVQEGVRGRDVQFGPYNASRVDNSDLTVNARTLETFLGSVVMVLKGCSFSSCGDTKSRPSSSPCQPL